MVTKKEWIKKHGEAGPFPHFLEPDVPVETKVEAKPAEAPKAKSPRAKK